MSLDHDSDGHDHGERQEQQEQFLPPGMKMGPPKIFPQMVAPEFYNGPTPQVIEQPLILGLNVQTSTHVPQLCPLRSRSNVPHRSNRFLLGFVYDGPGSRGGAVQQLVAIEN
jgi:hypothetical protein